ncbi:MAG: 1-acyl-sn-glycerol-3-phosphate acyltransferase [Phycisphaerales bacterium]|nr:1-acyl-sn-glycerol-3-phosphate acyltransferase [Phycisphaerales bacterium]
MAEARDTETRLPVRGPFQPLIYWGCWSAAALVATLLYRLRRIDPHRLPATGPVILAANHLSLLDPPLVGIAYTHRQVTFLARDTLFRGLFGRLISALNSIPIRRGAGDTGAIKACLAALERGDALLMFPEGTRSPDGRVAPFQRGLSIIVKKARCPVVPVAIDGPFEVWPRGRKLPRLLGRVAVRTGEPMSAEEFLADPDAALAVLSARIEAMRSGLRAAGTSANRV